MRVKLLIANRGEIALRIIRTCKKLGVRTVLVHSDPDAESLPIYYVTEKYPIGGATPAESYLSVFKIIDAALKTGCDGIHPGYGFLAEDPAFVRACEEKGLAFVGPTSSALEKLANKLTARRTMHDASIPVIPGSDGPVNDEEEALAVCDKIGYPVVLKAVYGGGGRGMRVARSGDDVRRFYRVIRVESAAAFGRDEVYIEKLLMNPRHVEVQAVAAGNGKIVTLGERECSIQRRHQKLLEEAPSTALNDEARQALSDAAKKGLAAAGYTNAGTVEFLLDQFGKFYFLEVNKRLQVEHLVTELTTGIDLVEEQLRVAFDGTLNLTQNEVSVQGWAINCRINAEDPRRGFAPSPGRIIQFQPPSGPGIRIDSALYAGYVVSEYYDSMIAKLAAWGRSRAEAIQRMNVALDEFEIAGIATTLPLHKAIMRDENFVRGAFDTAYLDRVLPYMNAELVEIEKLAAAAAAVEKMLSPHVRTGERQAISGSRWRTIALAESMRATSKVEL